MVLPGANHPSFPPVSEHVVEPESDQEMIDGRIVRVSPAHAPHADQQFRIANVLGPSVAPGYVGTTELLTRTSDLWNFAADVAIRKEGLDPATGRRYLEELAFEVKYTQSLRDITARARQLVNRGVRRVFMICVHANELGNHEDPGPAGPLMEWSPADNAWIELPRDAFIEDPCLHHPVRVQALLDAAEAKEAVARALLAEDNPVIAKAIDAATVEAERRRARESLYTILDARGLEVPELVRARIDDCEDVDRLTAWLRRAVTAASAGDVID